MSLFVYFVQSETRPVECCNSQFTLKFNSRHVQRLYNRWCICSLENFSQRPELKAQFCQNFISKRFAMICNILLRNVLGCFLKSISDFLPCSVDVIVYGSFPIDQVDHLFAQYGFPLLPVGVSQVVFHSDVCWRKIWEFEDNEDIGRSMSPALVPS